MGLLRGILNDLYLPQEPAAPGAAGKSALKEHLHPEIDLFQPQTRRRQKQSKF